jgi:ligand-binding sensor domain-containing protein/serine phosphatase RsbU (regulator of sigma subunit)
MRFNITLKISLSTIWCLFLFSAVLNSQTYSFKNYGTERNIPSGYVYTINQANDGYLWIGTTAGLTRFDGFSFIPVQYPDSISGRYPTVSLKDKRGTLWFGCSDGSVYFVRENKLLTVPLSKNKNFSDILGISEILEGPDGLIYIFPQGNAVFKVNPVTPAEISRYSLPEDQVVFSASFTGSGKILIGSQGDLLVCSLEKDSISVSEVIKGFNYSNITSIHRTDDSTRFVLGTDGNGLFQLKISETGHLLSGFRDHPEWESLSIQAISEDSDHNIWVATKESGAFRFHFSDNYESLLNIRSYNINSGLVANNVKTVFQDAEGNSWMGFSGEGISMLTSSAFGYYEPGKNTFENNIIFINSFNDKYFLGTPTGFHLFDASSGKSDSYSVLSGQVGKAEITSYYLDEGKNLWIGTGGNGLYLRDKSGSVRLYYSTGDTGSDYINDIAIDKKNIWLATINGVIVIDRRSGKFRKKFDITNGLPHNSINKIFFASDGSIYIGTESDRLCIISADLVINPPGNVIMSGSTKNTVSSFAEDHNGVIWAATKGNGVFEFFRKDSVSAINRTNDLMSNSCYSILADSEMNIWIGHDKGFSRFNPIIGTMKVFGTDFAREGVCNPNAIYESGDGKIFIGTSDGLIIFDRKNEKKSLIPPFNNVNYITINNVPYPFQSVYTLPYSKKNAIRVYFSGINFSAPEKVYYSTFLENFDDDWSKMSTSREVPYNLSDGKYKFNLISVNEEGYSQETPVSFTIIIKPPLWRRWWFILSGIIILAGIVVLIIRERDKAQKQVQEYLEKELAARTSVVMKQKGEIELQNIEITDSINYAKRIQTSILPDINKLKETFKDAFILFHPRDIVSGDFYWFDKLEDDKFIIVCADSTGHGVPGAFMSMIGSTLLQDIVTRQRITKPSTILSLLDKQIFSTLNQNVELGVSNDGMDMVVCEFNIKTRHIRFASAMRPLIIVLDGEPYYIKGNRLSVGGESVIEKYFDDQEYYLNEGDTVYLFSDGLPDQFGGVDGKKLKIARLKRLVEQVSKLPMEEQKAAISKFFFEWKGSYDQVDDILMMGVRV